MAIATNAGPTSTLLSPSRGQGTIGQGRACHTGLGILTFQHETGRPILNGWQVAGLTHPMIRAICSCIFYGLERRFFVDQSNIDAKNIIAEVRRLISVYPENHSVKRYLGEFLDIATLAETEFDALEPIFERQGWELPFSLKYAIGARLDKGEDLSTDWVLSWLMCHPESHLRTPASRCRHHPVNRGFPTRERFGICRFSAYTSE